MLARHELHGYQLGRLWPQPENGSALRLSGLSDPEVWPEAIRIYGGTQKKIKTTDRQAVALRGPDLLFPIISKMFSLRAATSPASAGFDPPAFKNLLQTSWCPL